MKGSRQPGSLRAVFVLVTGLCFGQLAAAIGLGPIQVRSYLGQPLDASIALRGISDTQAADSQIALGDAAAYQARGIARTASQSSLRFRMVKTANGYRISVTTGTPVKEPFINFILSMKTAGTIIDREYAVFLNPNPAAQAGIAPLPAAAAPSRVLSHDKKLLTATKDLPPPPNIAVKPAPSSQRVPRERQLPENTAWWKSEPQVKGSPLTDSQSAQKSPSRQAPVKRVSASDARYWQVKPGDTLYSIAAATLPSSGVSISSWMRTLYRGNRGAFIGNDMDHLISGARLVIPAESGVDRAAKLPRTARKAQKSKANAKKSRQGAGKDGAADNEAEEKMALKGQGSDKSAGKKPVIDPNVPISVNDDVLPVEKKTTFVAMQEEASAMAGEEKATAQAGRANRADAFVSSDGKKTPTVNDDGTGIVGADSAATPLATAETENARSPALAADSEIREDTRLTLDSPQTIAALPARLTALPEEPTVLSPSATQQVQGGSEDQDNENEAGIVAVRETADKADLPRASQVTEEQTKSGILAIAGATIGKAAQWVTEKFAALSAALPEKADALTKWALSTGPVGLPWWQIGVAAFVIVLLLLLLFVRRRRKANVDISEEELDRMVADMENRDLFADSTQLSDKERATLDQVMVDKADEMTALDEVAVETESSEETDFENQLLKDSDESGASDEADSEFLAENERVEDYDIQISLSSSEALASDRDQEEQAVEDDQKEDAFSLDIGEFSLEETTTETSPTVAFEDVTVLAESGERPIDEETSEADAGFDRLELEALDAETGEDTEEDENAFFADVSAGKPLRETVAGDALSSERGQQEKDVRDDDFAFAASPSAMATPQLGSGNGEKISHGDEQAMEINLDLASTYIESGVKPEKAKQWLNEVVRLGTPTQRDRARVLLDKLK